MELSVLKLGSSQTSQENEGMRLDPTAHCLRICLGTDPESWVSEFTPQKGAEEVSNLVLLP